MAGALAVLSGATFCGLWTVGLGRVGAPVQSGGQGGWTQGLLRLSRRRSTQGSWCFQVIK